MLEASSRSSGRSEMSRSRCTSHERGGEGGCARNASAAKPTECSERDETAPWRNVYSVRQFKDCPCFAFLHRYKDNQCIKPKRPRIRRDTPAKLMQ